MMIKRLFCLAVICAALVTVELPVHAQPRLGFVVVVNRSSAASSISKSELSRMMLRDLVRWPSGQPVEPVDLAASSAVREEFSRQVHGRSASQIGNFWRQQIFGGRGVPPPERANDAEVVRYVASHGGGLGYVSRSADVTSVKAIFVSGL